MLLHTAMRQSQCRKRKLSDEDTNKLHRAMRVRGASERAVHQIWNICHDDEEGKQVSRGSFERAVEVELSTWKDAFENMEFQCVDGSTMSLPILRLDKCLPQMCAEADSYHHAFSKALQQGGKLTPVLYCDEATAGNVLSVTKNRKCNLYYLSWLEMWHYLKSSQVWLPVAAVQSHALQNLVGGASALMVSILQLLLTDQNAEGFPLGNGLTFRQLKKAYFLGDHEAVRAIYSLKGSAGIRPCVFCQNIVKMGSDVVSYDGWFKEISAGTGFVTISDQEIFALCDKMLLPCTKKSLELQEKCAGLSYTPGSLLWPSEREKMAPSRILYDYMHTYLCNGIASWELTLLLEEVYTRSGVTLKLLQEAVVASNWTSFKASGKSPTYVKNLFHERMFGEGCYKGQVHQTAALVPLIRYYLETLFLISLPDSYVKSFRTLSNITKFVREIQHGLCEVDERAAAHLALLQERHHELFGQCYPDQYRPKHHHRFHLSEQWKKTGVALSCEGLESKHAIYKSSIGDHQRSLAGSNPSRFSAAVLARLLQRTCCQLQNNGLHFWELLPPIKDADMDDKIGLTSMGLKTSKSNLDINQV